MIGFENLSHRRDIPIDIFYSILKSLLIAKIFDRNLAFAFLNPNKYYSYKNIKNT
jgi:hypothetical protein